MLAFLLALGLPGAAHGQISANENATIAQMEAIIEGESIDISNISVVLGQGRQNGTFTGGMAAVGIDDGIYISTGRGSNINQNASVLTRIGNNGISPDPDLTAIRPTANRDTSAVSLQITPNKNTIFARFAFASEEYPDYVCDQFNDAFGLFISGGDLAGTENIAIVPGTGTDISINTVNNGHDNDGNPCPGEASNNSQFYNDNAGGIGFIFDGYTDVFEVVVDVTPGVTYDFKMVVADAVDNSHDSAIFFEVFDSRWVNDADLSLALTSSVTEPVVGEAFTITATVTNDGPDEVERVVVGDILPDGLTFVGITGAGSYDPSTDEWTLPTTLASGSSQSVTLQAIAYDTSTYSTTAEIIEQWANDPDSAPDNRATAPAEDDTASITLGPEPTYTLSGSIFLDNGAGGGTAFNALREVGEDTLAGLDVTLSQASDGAVLAVVQTDGAGNFALPIDGLAGQALAITTQSFNTAWQISEAPGALPGLVNPSTTDGAVTFTPAADTNYTNVNFGQLMQPLLVADQRATVEAGTASLLPHRYTASGPAAVTFTLENRTESLAGVISTTFHHDTDCSETLDSGDTLLSGAITVTAGDEICLLVRHVTAAATPQGTTLTYDVQAVTDYTGISLSETLTNSDSLTVTVEGTAELVKQVCNVTAGSCDPLTGAGFADNNAGAPGDILQYRLIFRSKGGDMVQNVQIYDDTPAYSFLKAGSAEVIRTPSSMNCSVVNPVAGGAEGYTGTVHWTCDSGEMSPGDEGIVAFRVQIEN